MKLLEKNQYFLTSELDLPQTYLFMKLLQFASPCFHAGLLGNSELYRMDNLIEQSQNKNS